MERLPISVLCLDASRMRTGTTGTTGTRPRAKAILRNLVIGVIRQAGRVSCADAGLAVPAPQVPCDQRDFTRP